MTEEYLTEKHTQIIANLRGQIVLIEALLDPKEFLIDSLTEEEGRK